MSVLMCYIAALVGSMAVNTISMLFTFRKSLKVPRVQAEIASELSGAFAGASVASAIFLFLQYFF